MALGVDKKDLDVSKQLYLSAELLFSSGDQASTADQTKYEIYVIVCRTQQKRVESCYTRQNNILTRLSRNESLTTQSVNYKLKKSFIFS